MDITDEVAARFLEGHLKEGRTFEDAFEVAENFTNNPFARVMINSCRFDLCHQHINHCLDAVREGDLEKAREILRAVDTANAFAENLLRIFQVVEDQQNRRKHRDNGQNRIVKEPYRAERKSKRRR